MPDIHSTVVTTLRTQPHQRDGRVGHEIKNIVSGMLLAAVQGWRFMPPPSHGPFGFREVAEIIDVARLALNTPAKLGPADAASPAGRHCPLGWQRLLLNDTGFSGIEDFDGMKAYLLARLKSTDPARALCIVTINGFRLHLHHVYAWERKGLGPVSGVYDAVLRVLRSAFRERTAPKSDDPQPHPPASQAVGRADALAARRGVFAIHVRRGDKLGRGATQRYPISLVRAFASLGGHALLGTKLFPLGVDVRIYTEPANSSELFAAGCPPTLLAVHFSCEVRTASVGEDLHDLVRADVLGLSSSSFSVLAYYLRDATQPALSPLRSISQFFSAPEAANGRAGASRGRGLVTSSWNPKATVPENLMFSHLTLQHAIATEGSAPPSTVLGSTTPREPGASVVSSSDPVGVLLMTELKNLVRFLRRALLTDTH